MTRFTGEFLVLRHGEPFLFGLELVGPTWVDPLLFNRPIERLGGGLELFWNGQLVDRDKAHITRVLAHWKKMLNRRVKRSGLPLGELIDMNPLPSSERDDFLSSVERLS